MVTQLLSQSPVSTLAHVKTVLQGAIEQEAAVIEGAQSRLVCYQQQLASLESLVSAPSPGQPASESVSPLGTNGVMNGATNGATNGDNGVSSALPTSVPPKPKGGQSLKQTGKKAATKGKVSAAQLSPTLLPETVSETVPALVEPPGIESPTVLQPAAPAAAPAPAVELAGEAPPKFLLRWRGSKSTAEAIVFVLKANEGKQMSAREITRRLYGPALLQDEELAKALSRTISGELRQGETAQKWLKTGNRPVLYYVSEPVASVTVSEPVASVTVSEPVASVTV